jgi:hypothetical protein
MREGFPRGSAGSKGALCLLGALWLVPAAASAQEDEEPQGTIDSLATFLVDAMSQVWTGPRVEPPPQTPRPDMPIALRSDELPLAVHATADSERAEEVLRALEDTYRLLEKTGWPTHLPDGGYGGSDDFDLYLADEPQRSTEAFADTERSWVLLDEATTFAVMDAGVDPIALEACVASAYAEAVLYAQDPAESVAWRRATADFVSWLVTGRFGCDEAAGIQQREPWRSPIEGAAGSGAGGAGFLAFLSERHDRGSGAFIRDLWALARQNTWEGHGLRASPDLWEALDVMIERSEDTMDELVLDYSVARWFTGEPARERQAPEPVLNAMPRDAIVPYVDTIRWDELSEHSAAADPPIEPLGTGYVEIDVSGAPANATLELWLRGEYGVEWAMVAFRVDRNRHELGRVSTPVRLHTNAYLQVSLFENTDRVIVAVTNFSSRLPDADEPDENLRSFHIIADDVAREPPEE